MVYIIPFQKLGYLISLKPHIVKTKKITTEFINHNITYYVIFLCPVPQIFRQYSPEELLQIGTHPMCRMVPEDWIQLCQEFPDVCLPIQVGYIQLNYHFETSLQSFVFSL